MKNEVWLEAYNNLSSDLAQYDKWIRLLGNSKYSHVQLRIGLVVPYGIINHPTRIVSAASLRRQIGDPDFTMKIGDLTESQMQELWEESTQYTISSPLHLIMWWLTRLPRRPQTCTGLVQHLIGKYLNINVPEDIHPQRLVEQIYDCCNDWRQSQSREIYPCCPDQ